ncbi:MAG: helix-turn-helix domain-containing protein [Janthinobacterium lividum]
MVVSRMPRLKLGKEEREKRKLTYRVIASEAGISSGVVTRLMNGVPDRIDTEIVDTLCRYFGCGIGDLLEYVPDETKEAV